MFTQATIPTEDPKLVNNMLMSKYHIIVFGVYKIFVHNAQYMVIFIINIGSHQGHDVKAIKKAIIDVRKQFGGYIEKIEKYQTNYKKTKDTHTNGIR
jgi:hypothetical protein